MGSPRIADIRRHDSAAGSWTHARCDARTDLRPWVVGYSGYVETTQQSIRRREVPSPIIAVILNLGPPWRMIDADQEDVASEHDSFIAGLHDRFAIVDSTGAADCMQIDFTILGAARFLRVPMHELANATTAFEDVLGRAGREFLERLRSTPAWADRFDQMDDFLAARMQGPPNGSEGVAWAVSRIESSAGLVSIGALASEMSWSRKRLLHGFREHVGLPAKTLARVVRFDHATKLLEAEPRTRLADVAASCGYADQAHMTREFRRLAGWSPTEVLHQSTGAGEGLLDV